MQIKIRPAVAADASAILRLNAAFEDVRATVDHIAAHIENHAQFETPFVAILDERIVGLACLRLLPCLCDPAPYAELTELVVDPNYRHRGVGRCLVQYIERKARALGAVTLTLMTAWENTGAHAFYQALGYNLYTISMQRSLLDIEQSPT